MGSRRSPSPASSSRSAWKRRKVSASNSAPSGGGAGKDTLALRERSSRSATWGETVSRSSRTASVVWLNCFSSSEKPRRLSPLGGLPPCSFSSSSAIQHSYRNRPIRQVRDGRVVRGSPPGTANAHSSDLPASCPHSRESLVTSPPQTLSARQRASSFQSGEEWLWKDARDGLESARRTASGRLSVAPCPSRRSRGPRRSQGEGSGQVNSVVGAKRVVPGVLGGTRKERVVDGMAEDPTPDVLQILLGSVELGRSQSSAFAHPD
jgi:hypothetical protein